MGNITERRSYVIGNQRKHSAGDQRSEIKEEKDETDGGDRAGWVGLSAVGAFLQPEAENDSTSFKNSKFSIP